MTNLDKITPAPWEAHTITPAPWEAHTEHDDPIAAPWVGIAGDPICGLYWLCHEQTKDATDAMVAQVEANAEFIALARNAFDVMMRRGWTACRSSSGEWYATWPDPDTVFAFGNATGNSYPDPFTAIVEADRWYRENVEK